MKLTLGAVNRRLDSSGILYLLSFTLEDVPLVKIGMTCRPQVEERVCEILTSIWKRYRVFPECYVKRFRKVEEVAFKETLLLKQFAEFAYKPAEIFTGCTELVTTPLVEVVLAYDALTADTESSR